MKRFYKPILGCLTALLLSSNASGQSFSFSGTSNTLTFGTPLVLTTTMVDQGIINVSEGKVPTVVLNVDHAFTGDLDISLTSPEGTTIDLSSDNGGGGDNYTNTVFRHVASQSITAGTAPFNGSFTPEESFSNFDGEQADGVWTLTIVDDGSGDDGTFSYAYINIRDRNAFTYSLDNQNLNRDGSYSNNLILPATGVTWTENIHNQPNSALAFDGNSHATATNQDYPTNNATFAAWIKPTNVMNDQKIIGIVDFSNVDDLISLGIQNGEIKFETINNGIGAAVTGGNLTANEWAHIAGVWSGATNTLTIYVNGNQVGTTTGAPSNITFTTPTSPTSFRPVLGAAAWNTSSFKYQGTMDDIRVFGDPLSEWQIKDMVANRNEYCAGAVNLPVIGNSCDGSYYAQSFGGNGANGPGVQCNGSISGSSWFTVTVPSSGNVNISSSSVSGSTPSNFDNVIEAYSGSCGNLTYINCNDQANGGSFAELQLTGLTPGNVIYVRSRNYYTAESRKGQYVICAFEPLPIAGNPSTVSPLCNGGDTGSASVTPSGGNAPYSYLWNTGSTSSSLMNVTAGTYTCIITDNSGATYDETVVVTEPTVISVATSTTGATAGNNDGSATANPTGGTAPYSYLWSNGNVTQTATSLGVGTFNVTITDANGCTASGSASVSQSSVGIEELNSLITVNLYPNPAVDQATIDASLENAEETEITLFNTMGQLIQTVQLGNSKTLSHTFNVNELPAGTYFVKISTTSGLNQMKRLIIKK